MSIAQPWQITCKTNPTWREYNFCQPEEEAEQTITNKNQSHAISCEVTKQPVILFTYTVRHSCSVLTQRYLFSIDSLHINEWVIMRDSRCWKDKPTLLTLLISYLNGVSWSDSHSHLCNPKCQTQSRFFKGLLRDSTCDHTMGPHCSEREREFYLKY